MITDRSQYDFVTIPAEIVVDGGIMPARDVAGDGSWKVLRGEDPAFLMEGVGERLRVVDGNTSYSKTMDKSIIGSRMSDVVRDLKSLPGVGFCMKIGDFNSFWDVSNQEFMCIAKNHGSELSHFYCNENDFSSGHALVANDVRKVFYDMQRLRCFDTSAQFVEGDPWDITKKCSAWSHSYTQKGNHRMVEADEQSMAAFNCIIDYEMYGIYETALERIGDDSSTRTSHITNGQFHIKIPDAAVGWINESSVQGYAMMHIVNYGTGMPPESHYCLVPVECSCNNGYIRFASSALLNSANIIDSHYGIQRLPYTIVSSSKDRANQSYSIQLINIFAYVELTGHTDISYIGWEWNP